MLKCPIFSATQKGQDYFGEEIFRHKNGQLLTVELSCKPIINNALIDGAVTALRDITERKANEERLRETDRLKNEFLANVSHEFRTPLTVIMAAIEHLQDIVKDLEHRKLLQIVDQASQRLHKLINEILDFSKIEAKKLVIWVCLGIDIRVDADRDRRFFANLARHLVDHLKLLRRLHIEHEDPRLQRIFNLVLSFPDS